MKWGEKRYYSLDYYMKSYFGGKVWKLSLDGGMTCPNRDGSLGDRGCIFCSEKGSGDYSYPICESITSQIDNAINNFNSLKHTEKGFIAYFQSFTNTYAATEHLKNIFEEAINHPEIAGLSIATRPDCLPDDVLALISDLNKIKPVWVELGLQTIHEPSASFIRRGYPLSVYDTAVNRLHNIGANVITHVILGLPGETSDHMLATIRHVACQSSDGIKLQLLHIIKGTDLEKYYGSFHVLSEDEYVDIVIRALEILPPDIVIHRITGDGPRDSLIAPLWSLNKRHVLNHINSELKLRNTWQSRLYEERIL